MKRYKYSIKPNSYGYLRGSYTNFYDFYKTNYPNDLIEYNLARKILERIFILIWHKMIKDLWIFKAPAYMGKFFISESQYTRGRYKDWQASRKAGKMVWGYNFDTGGRKPFIKWDKSFIKVRNNDVYDFRAYRGDKESCTGFRGLWGYIKECAIDPFKEDFKAHYL